MEKLKNRLQLGMSLRGIRQVDIARACGVSRATACQWTKGICEPKGRNVLAICKLLNVQEGWLLGYDVPMEKDDKPTAKLEEMFCRLDDIDKGIILGQMINMLSSDKYKKESANIG